MRTNMRTSDGKRLARVGCLFVMGASTWLGCSVDATPSKGPEKVVSTSQAVTGTGLTIPNPPQCAGITTIVLAYHHSPNAPDQLNGYTISSPEPSVYADAAVRAYEEQVWSDVYRSNGYAYQVTIPSLQNGVVYRAVGINNATTSPPYSTVPTAGNSTVGEPTVSDWDEENTLASENTGPSVGALYPPLTCVGVYAKDTGAFIEFFPVLDVHDPDPGGW
jgi:hypothetical protein